MGSAEVFRPVSTVTAVETAIRKEVLTGALAAGTKLSEVELVGRYDVSRNSLRAALQALVQSGLLRHERNRGVFVPTMTVDDVDDVFHVRSAVEGHASRFLVREQADLAGVEEALGRMRELGADADWLEAVELDLKVHEALVAATGSRRLVRIHGDLLDEQRLLLAQVKDHYPQPQIIVPVHEELVAALRAGDEGQAVGAVDRHLEESAAEIRAILATRG